ncbi:MAG: hypothetical protein SGJ26_05555 [Nitrospirota bacterium]|nr:hypothetical protein [Nitrospirota bacterium]
MLNVAGLVLDIVGAFILMWGELHQSAALLKYQGRGEGQTWFDSQVKKLIWWKQWPLKFARAWGSTNSADMGQESIFDSFPLKAWGIVLLIFGFLLQVLASLIH